MLMITNIRTIGDYIMTATATTTTISRKTLDVLKNFSAINSNILVKAGNVLSTISPVKNVMARASGILLF